MKHRAGFARRLLIGPFSEAWFQIQAKADEILLLVLGKSQVLCCLNGLSLDYDHQMDNPKQGRPNNCVPVSVIWSYFEFDWSLSLVTLPAEAFTTVRDGL